MAEEDEDDGLTSMGFMFDNEQETKLKTFSFMLQASSPPLIVVVSLNVVDDDPGAVISGHYLWPASHLMANLLVNGKTRVDGEVRRCQHHGMAQEVRIPPAQVQLNGHAAGLC